MRLFTLCFLVSQGVCWGADPLCVRNLVVPEYPRLAVMAGIQGEVKVEVEIGTDGKVSSAKARVPSGAPKSAELLSHAAEKNIMGWIFEPPIGAKTFPLRQTVTYVYRIRGEPVFYPPCPTLVLRPPDHVEIVVPPMHLEPSQQN